MKELRLFEFAHHRGETRHGGRLRDRVDARREIALRRIELAQRRLRLQIEPADAHVEIAAKKAAGYYAPQEPKPQDLADTVGRSLDKN